MLIKKLVTFPAYVWADVEEYVNEKFNMEIPKHNFKFSKFLYSPRFDYKTFVVNISEKQALLLFSLICQKVGIGFIEDSEGWKTISLTETSDELLNSCRFSLDEVRSFDDNKENKQKAFVKK